MDLTNVNYIAQARTRVTEQFKNKPNFDNLLKIWLNGYQQIEDVLIDIETIKNIDKSSGAQLDNIGVIIGQPRTLVDIDTSGYFGFQTDPGAKSFGSTDNSAGGYYYSLDNPESGTVTLSDGLYRIYLKAKIIQNNTGSTPEEVIEATRIIFNTEIVEYFEGSSIDETEPAVFTLNVGRAWNDAELTAFPGLDETQIADRLLPKPAGVRIEYTNESVTPTLLAVDRWVESANSLYYVANTKFINI